MSMSRKRKSHRRRVKSAKASRRQSSKPRRESCLLDNQDIDSGIEESDTETSNVNPVLMLQLKNTADVIKIQTTFVNFEKMLKQQK